jgi:hypothetical protein
VDPLLHGKLCRKIPAIFDGCSDQHDGIIDTAKLCVPRRIHSHIEEHVDQFVRRLLDFAEGNGIDPASITVWDGDQISRKPLAPAQVTGPMIS